MACHSLLDSVQYFWGGRRATWRPRHGQQTSTTIRDRFLNPHDESIVELASGQLQTQIRERTIINSGLKVRGLPENIDPKD